MSVLTTAASVLDFAQGRGGFAFAHGLDDFAWIVDAGDPVCVGCRAELRECCCGEAPAELVRAELAGLLTWDISEGEMVELPSGDEVPVEEIGHDAEGTFFVTTEVDGDGGLPERVWYRCADVLDPGTYAERYQPGPLSVTCPTCQAGPRVPCAPVANARQAARGTYRRTTTHAARARLATGAGR